MQELHPNNMPSKGQCTALIININTRNLACYTKMTFYETFPKKYLITVFFVFFFVKTTFRNLT